MDFRDLWGLFSPKMDEVFDEVFDTKLHPSLTTARMEMGMLMPLPPWSGRGTPN